MKKKKKIASGSVKVDPDTLEKVRTICEQNGIKLSFFATEALKEKIKSFGNVSN